MGVFQKYEVLWCRLLAIWSFYDQSEISAFLGTKSRTLPAVVLVTNRFWRFSRGKADLFWEPQNPLSPLTDDMVLLASSERDLYALWHFSAKCEAVRMGSALQSESIVLENSGNAPSG